MYTFFLVVHAIVAAALVGVILMQRSEGGGLAGGGNPAGLMSARGAADFLTRTTTILAVLFVSLSIALAAIAITNRAPKELDTSLAAKPTSAPAVPASAVPMAGVPTTLPAVADVPAVTAPPVADKPKTETRSAEPTIKPVVKDQAVKAPRPVVRDVVKEVVKPVAEKIAPPPVVAPTAPAETGNSPQ